MKKVTFVTLARDGKDLLARLQELGVMHPEHIKDIGESPEFEQLVHKLHVQDVVITSLESRKIEGDRDDSMVAPPTFSDVEGWLSDERHTLEAMVHVKRTIDKQKPIGDFDPHDVERLRERGISIQLWVADKKRFGKLSLPKGVALRVLSEDGDVYFTTVFKGEPVEIEGVESIPLPHQSLKSLIEMWKELQDKKDALVRQIGRASLYIDEFRAKNRKLIEKHNYYEAYDRAFGNESVMAFEGWVPTDDIERVRMEVERSFKAVLLRARDPFQDEIPPVKTRNTWIAKTFEPLLHLLGMPKYRGIDPALYFAPSMMLFFGICLGDAGYGFLMVLFGVLMKRYLKRRVHGIEFVSNMTMLFGIVTVIWGLMTGAVFGIQFTDRGWILLDVSTNEGDPMMLFYISIALGLIHLTIAFILAMVHAPSLGYRLMKFGMIAVLWGGVLFVLKIQYWWILIALGIGLILFFSSDSKNPLKRVGLGMWSIYGLTSLLGDVMSYARLFGLGVASAAIASVVNMLANDVKGAVPGFGIVLAVLVLLVGHCFNFAMSIIGALVHPARLHAVEAFPKCVELTGKPYKPLSKATVANS